MTITDNRSSYGRQHFFTRELEILPNEKSYRLHENISWHQHAIIMSEMKEVHELNNCFVHGKWFKHIVWCWYWHHIIWKCVSSDALFCCGPLWYANYNISIHYKNAYLLDYISAVTWDAIRVRARPGPRMRTSEQPWPLTRFTRTT